MRAKALLSCLVLIGAAGLFDAKSEVSARVDETGQYIGMLIRINNSASRRIWASGMVTVDRRPLNPTGDILGDLAPTVVENPANSNYPYAFWAHPNGGDYDLVFSRWTGAGWSPTQFVQSDNFTNEFEPRAAFSSTGRPFLVWWSDENGVGSVYFSMFLQTRWMTPIRVSAVGVDSRHAEAVIFDDLTVGVFYDIPNGHVWRMVTIPDRNTITDDIDPKIRSEIIVE